MSFKLDGSNLKPWTFEILALVSSIAMVISMTVLLAAYDRKPIFESKRWTLNAFISILSTASKGTLLTSVGSCISQGNWILFSGNTRRLYDFEMVSAASRGPLGSLKVLVSLSIRGGGLVRLGALATILSLAMDPFSQQLVQLHQGKNGRIGQASIPYATRYSQGSGVKAPLVGIEITHDGHVELSSGESVYANADFAMQSAISFGLTADLATVRKQASFHCPGAQCDFKPLESLSVCSRCSDITQKLKKNTVSQGGQLNDLIIDQSWAAIQPNSTEYRLSNGLFLNNMEHQAGPRGEMVYMTMMATSNPNKTVTMNNIDTLIWSQTVIKVDADPNSNSDKTWPDFDVNAFECALYYCVRNYTAEYKDGMINLTSKELTDLKRDPKSWASTNSLVQPGDGISDNVIKSLAYHPQDSIITRTDLQLRRDGAKVGWNVSDAAVYGISYYMQTIFAVCLNLENCTDAFSLEDWNVPNGYYVSFAQQEEHRPSVAKIFREADDFGQIFENIAASMSNVIRSGADGGIKEKGDVLESMTIYVVSWPWIMLHCVTELGALILLTLTIWPKGRAARDVPVLKSSELAVFSKGCILGDVFKGTHTVEDFEERAKHVPAVLIGGEKDNESDDTDEFPRVERRDVV